MQNTYGQCRCCLVSGYHKNMRDIEEDNHREAYIDMFSDCFNLFLSTNIDLTSLICKSCIEELHRANRFKTMVIQNEQKLLAMSSNKHVIYINLPQPIETEAVLKVESVKSEPLSDNEQMEIDNVSDFCFNSDDNEQEKDKEGESKLLARCQNITQLPTRDMLYTNGCAGYVKHLDLLKGSKSKTTSRRPRAGDIPTEPSRSQASKRLNAMVSDGRKGANVPDYGDLLPDIPENLLADNISTPSVSLLGSNPITLNLSPEHIDAPPALPLRSQSSTPDLPSDNDDAPLPQNSRNNSSSHQGATTIWSSNPISMKTIDFTKKQGLLVPPPSDPYDAFRLLIDDDLLDLIVRETNENAVRLGVADNVKQNSRLNNWKDLTREELMTFLGLLLHTGTIRLNRVNDYWKRHHLFNIPCFGKFMSRNRFLLILRCLHFTSESSEEDRLIKIRPLMDHFNNKMINIYCPGKHLSLDESMVLWRGRLLFRQTIKNKRFRETIKNKKHKYGFKLYVLAEPDGTILKYQVYAGVNDETSEQGHSSKIVLKLLEERLDSGHHVYMDSYYNSYGLAVTLLDRQTYCTGTLTENRKDNPVEIGTILLEKGENKSLFLNGVHIGKWRDKCNVLYISTEHDDQMVETFSKRGSVVFKPSAIVHYNNFMSGIDLQDQMLAYYPVQRKTLRWYKKLFVHMIQMSLSNAFYLYNKFSANDKMNLYDFRLKILERLLPDPNEVNRLNALKVKHELTKIEKTRARQKKVGNVMKETTEVARKECKGCKAQKKRVQTIYECKQCEGSPGFCTKCFCQAHS